MATSVKEIASLQSDVANIKETVNGLKGYLERSGQERTTQYTQTVKDIAVLQNTLGVIQNSVDKYQEECVTDRKSHINRLESLENNQSSIKGRATAMSVGTSIFIGLGTLWATLWHK